MGFRPWGLPKQTLAFLADLTDNRGLTEEEFGLAEFGRIPTWSLPKQTLAFLADLTDNRGLTEEEFGLAEFGGESDDAPVNRA